MFGAIFGQRAALENENSRLRSRVSQLEKELKQLESKYEGHLDQFHDSRDDARALSAEYTIVLDRLSCALSSAVLTALGYDKKDKDCINLLRSVDDEELKDQSDNYVDEKVLKKANEIRSEALNLYGLYDFARIFMPSAKEGSIAVKRMDRSDRASYYKELDRAIGLDDQLKQEKRG